MITWHSPIETVLGDASAKRKRIVEGLGLRTVGDLLSHHPRRYLKTGELSRVEDLEVGQFLTIVGKIVRSKQFTYKDRRTGQLAFRQEVTLATDGPELTMTFFAKKKWSADWHDNTLREGKTGVFTGQVGSFRGDWQLTNPRMEMFADEGPQLPTDLPTPQEVPPFMPIYPLTKGVDTWDLQRAVAFALTVLEDIPEAIPAGIRERWGLAGALDALRWVHAPETIEQANAAQRRFRFEEALVTQVVMARRRAVLQAAGAQARVGGGGLLAAFDERIPFTLTEGQRAVSEAIFDDLARPHPMNRLLQGEVGSGKTVVALRAMLRVIDSGGQAALLAPTEVLAGQHHRSITELLGDLAAGGMLGGAEDGTRVALLTGSMPKAKRQDALLATLTGDVGILIGTHALLEEAVTFADLGLVVVDEQHRFGVEQRAALTDKAGTPPHTLVMTATPIPRSVAMTIFGDLEVSTLHELPAGRSAVTTHVVALLEQPHWMERCWERVREEVAAGRQAYVVCPRITGDIAEQGEVPVLDRDDDGVPIAPVREGSMAAVEEVSAHLKAGPLADLRVEMLHGRMTGEHKDRVMRAFAAGEIDVLVATTVIEVGVDVPNATTMIILDADRFGISQLHQLRGRIGRGEAAGLCLLVSHAAAGAPSRERLDAVAATTDGFELSRHDLEQRREGDVLGASQSGRRSSLQSLRVLRDEETIAEARKAAEVLMDDDPTLSRCPELFGRVAALELSSESGFMEKS
ncbi:MAG: ATP-dependent DNA helicase RecG [Nocardioides sp.]